MKKALASLLLVTSISLFAKGPFPHERSDTPKLRNSTTGRFMYVGDVPKFEGHEIEMTISKLNLTSRVTAYVNQGRIDTYAHQLFMRWKNINDATMDPVFSLHPLVKLSKLAENKSLAIQAWAKIAEQYSSHILEKTSMDIYLDKRNKKNYVSNEEDDNYRELISHTYFQYIFDTKEKPDSIIDDNAKLEKLLSAENSQRLFEKHLGHLFTPSTERPGYIGFITLVYPIAATVDGPFAIPRETVTYLKSAESMESRWWSDKWNDEFGGFPFLLIQWNGVAFHGPITNYSPMDIWYLRRGYVSHGCHRMDTSDILELRALMPNDLKKTTEQIKVTILDYFDVVDWNRDGKLEAIDVKYYQIPVSISVPKNKSVEEVIKPFLVENQRSSFIKNNPYAAKYLDRLNGQLKDIPKYEFGKLVIKKNGVHKRVDIHSFDYRPNRILQYTEEGYKPKGYDDTFGKYPPKYFQQY